MSDAGQNDAGDVGDPDGGTVDGGGAPDGGVDPWTTATVGYETCFDLETGTEASGSIGCHPDGDLIWAYNSNGAPYHRAFWNEQYVDVAFVAAPFDDVTGADIDQVTFCDHINDPSAGCQDSDPYSALGENRTAIYFTGAGNYYKVGVVSENDATFDVTFRYELLIAP